MQVEVYETGSEGSPARDRGPDPGRAGRPSAGLRVTFVRERQFTGLIVGQGPGRRLRLARLLPPHRSALALVFFFPSRRVWALIRGGSGRQRPSTSARSSATTSASRPSSPASADEIQARPRRIGQATDRKGTGPMFKMSEYSFIAGVISVALALGCYVIAFASVRVARVVEHGASPARPPDGGTVAIGSAQRTAPAWAPTARSSPSSRSIFLTASLIFRTDRHRPRPVRQHVRVLDRLRLGHRWRCTSTSSAATTSGSSASSRCRSRWLMLLYAMTIPAHDRSARAGPPEQPAAVRPRGRRDRRLRDLHGRLRRRGPVPGPAAERPPRPAAAASCSTRSPTRRSSSASRS